MAAQRHDLQIARGEDFNFTLRITDSFNDPVSFTLSSCKAEIREDFQKPLIASFTLTDLGDGTIKFMLPTSATKFLPINKNLKWDFFFADNGGLLSKKLYGKVTVDSNISYV